MGSSHLDKPVHNTRGNEEALWFVVLLLVQVHDLFYSIVPIKCLDGNANVRFFGWRPDGTAPYDLLLDDHSAGSLLWNVEHVVGHLVGILH